MNLNTRSVMLQMKIIDRGYAGMCPNTFKERRYFAIQDEAGVLREEIKLTCTRKELDQKVAQIRVQYNITGNYSTRPAPWQTRVVQDKLNGAEPIGPGWSCRKSAEHALQAAGLPKMFAQIGGFAVDVALTKKMHKDFLTNGPDMRKQFDEVFKWHQINP